MELFPANSKIRFMRWRHISVWGSLALMVLSIVSIATRGFNLALDFSGGALVEVKFEQEVTTPVLRDALAKGGLGEAMVQSYSSREFAVRMRMDEVESKAGATTTAEDAIGAMDARVQEVRDRIGAALQQAGLVATLGKPDYVGGQVGAELLEDGLLAILLVGLGILIYIALRFEWKFAVAAVACSVHDFILMLGFFSITGIEFDLNVLAALMALIGHSLNDTIVVFDRVREMFRSARKDDTISLFDKALNSTLSRTIMTSVTTLFAVLAMYFLGGPVLYGLALCLLVGIFVGTLSSIFFACPMLLLLGANKRDLVRPEQDPRLAAMP